MDEGRWRGWENAEIYDRFVREHAIYRWLNARLVERAHLAGARRVLDLGCGTGATAQACLAVLGPEAEVAGVDASAEMVEVARAATQDPRARFHVAPAERAEAAVQGPFDRAVSNAAFWMFPAPEAVLAGLARLLSPDGLFVFNVPSERIGQGAGGEAGRVHPFQVALASAIAERTGEPFARSSRPFSPEAFRAQAARAGLQVEAEEELVYEGRQGELVELMSIPAMISPLTAGLSDADVEAVLARARAAVEPEERVQVAWTYVTARRREGA
jgi:SAM-dependent methyltransferase